jgi:hypothetical protein
MSGILAALKSVACANRRVMLLGFAIATLFSSTGSAATYVTSTINAIGCHNVDDTCYVDLETETGTSNCTSNSIRWYSDSDAGGSNALSLLMAAYLAGRTVHFAISQSVCVADTYPAFTYIKLL